MDPMGVFSLSHVVDIVVGRELAECGKTHATRPRGVVSIAEAGDG